GLKAKETEAREAEAWKTHLEGLTEQQQRDVNRIADLRQMREDRRATCGGNAPKDFNARRQMIEETQKLREDAKRAGLSAEETNARVMDETERVALAEAAAFGLEADLRARPQATPQEVGGKLQQAASDIYEHGVAARKKAAGIEQVLAKADKPVDAAGVVNYVDKVVEDIPSTHPARAVLERVKRDAMGVKEESAEQTPEILPGETPSQASARRAKSQEASEAAKDEPGTMSLRKLEALRSTIRSALQTKTMKLDNGNVLPIDAGTWHHLKETYKAISKDIDRQSPELSAALDRFREMSRPLDVFRTSMKDVVAGDLFSDEFQMGQAMVADKLVSRAKQGQTPIAALVQKRPDLKDDLERLFNYKLFGYGDELPTAQAHAKFLQQNEN